ncbi:MAG: 4-hydroxy-tetrahydrodipicolinate reductase [Actinomycetota bacterium]
MIKVGVIGAGGRMGAESCGAIEADAELELAASVKRGDSLDALVDCEVVVEFSTADSVKANVLGCIERGVRRLVVGASGLSAGDLAEVGAAATEARAVVFVAPNFAIGAVLMMRFAAQAAPYFEVAEIIERHHERKLDSPSGTALRTAELMNEGRSQPWQAPGGGKQSLEGARGGDFEGVRVHSVRMQGSVAHQEVILGSPGQTLTIRHDSIDRASFMPGVVLAIKKVAAMDVDDQSGLHVGLENLLDL